MAGGDEPFVDGRQRTRLSLAESRLRCHDIQQWRRPCYAFYHLDWADARSAAVRCDKSSVADWILGHLLGVLVPDCPNDLGASHRVGFGNSLDTWHGDAAAAAVWRESSCACGRLSVSRAADAEAGPGGAAVRHYISRYQETEDRRLADSCGCAAGYSIALPTGTSCVPTREDDLRPAGIHCVARNHLHDLFALSHYDHAAAALPAGRAQTGAMEGRDRAGEADTAYPHPRGTTEDSRA